MKFPTEQWTVIDMHKLEEIVEREFGKKFRVRLAPGELPGQDTVFEVDVEEDLYNLENFSLDHNPEYGAISIDQWINGDPRIEGQDAQPQIGVLVRELQNRGWEIPNEFRVHIWW